MYQAGGPVVVSSVSGRRRIPTPLGPFTAGGQKLVVLAVVGLMVGCPADVEAEQVSK